MIKICRSKSHDEIDIFIVGLIIRCFVAEKSRRFASCQSYNEMLKIYRVLVSGRAGSGSLSLSLSHPLTGSLSFSLYFLCACICRHREAAKAPKRFAAAALRAAVWFDRPNFPGHLVRKLLCTTNVAPNGATRARSYANKPKCDTQIIHTQKDAIWNY